jgi:murein DD-endopeptidase MepM/ murein hydrolase activator NlpD
VPAGTEAPVGDVPSKAPQGEPPPQWEWQDVTVARGDNLSLVFHRLGLSAATLHRVLALGEPTQALHDLRPGQVLRFAVAEGPPPRLSALEYHPDPVHYLRIERDGDGFRAELHERPVQVRSARAAGVIHDSLFASAARAGLTDRIIMGLAQVFGWDIDFALDIREGDRFAVVYEERYLDDRKVEDGPVLAAEFVNRGKTYRALRYTDSTGRSGYYTPDGHNLRRAFLRTPVEFSRISSRFSLGRYHPVLHRIRAHKGVDYAARTGTPVRATADGKVVFKGRHGGYGRVVRLQHGSRYMTVYAHLSRYARGLRQGKWVKQGQVIGYVGQSGLATGPHLHYEFRVNGVHKDPLTVALPAADPIDPRYLSDFKAKTRTLVAALDALAGTAVALGRP